MPSGEWRCSWITFAWRSWGTCSTSKLIVFKVCQTWSNYEVIKRANKVIQHRRVYSLDTHVIHTYYMHKFTSDILGQSFDCEAQRQTHRLSQHYLVSYASQRWTDVKFQATSDLPDRLPDRLNVWLTLCDLRGKNVIVEKTKVEDMSKMKERNNNNNMHTHIINTLVYNSDKQEAQTKWCFLSPSLLQLERLRKRTS